MAQTRRIITEGNTLRWQDEAPAAGVRPSRSAGSTAGNASHGSAAYRTGIQGRTPARSAAAESIMRSSEAGPGSAAESIMRSSEAGPGSRTYTGAQTESRPRTRASAAYGTAAPQLDPQPAPRRKPAPTARPARHTEAARSTHREGIRPGYIVFIILGVAIIAVACIYMLGIRSDLTALQNTYEAKEEELQQLRAANDSKEIYLNKSIDLNEVYRIATEELGMVYPSNDQIIYYERTDGGYVRQYEDIPTE